MSSMVPEAAAGIGRVGYLIANSAAVDAVGGALITVLLGWAVQLFADRKRLAWRAYLDTRINLTPAQAARLRFRVYVDEPGAQPSSEVKLPWLALLRVRNAGFVPIRGTDFHTPLTFVFPGREVRGAEVIDHSGAAQPALAGPPPADHVQQAQRVGSARPVRVDAAGQGGVVRWLRGWVTGMPRHPGTMPDGPAPTDRVQLGEGLLLNRRDRFTVMVVLSGTPSDARKRIRQTGSLIGGRIVAEPPRRGPNTRSMLFGGSVALPLAGLLLGLLVSLSPPPGSHCTGGSLTLEGSTAFQRVPGAPAAHALACLGDDAGHVEVRYMREGHREHLLHEAPADRHVQRVERGTGHLHHHLPRSRHRSVGVLVDQDAAVAVRVVTHCLHDFSSRLRASKLKHIKNDICFDFEATSVRVGDERHTALSSQHVA
jgi:hypothetical protein